MKEQHAVRSLKRLRQILNKAERRNTTMKTETKIKRQCLLIINICYAIHTKVNLGDVCLCFMDAYGYK